MTVKRDAPTTTEQRLDRLELSVAQIATALRQCSAWRPLENGQTELQEILDEQRVLIQQQRRAEAVVG